ncbi:MAG: UDP-N-acetylglucosamine 1-carboxyvinyltransferase [FCB group bacterium]|nr:UDP-N-acetylglucosamine 1-carboxyvinyltransferase [FCB group bacterium]
MDKIIINGGNQLNGAVKISGAKNAVLPIMAATLITPGIFKIHNVPDLRDTRTMARLLEMIGAKVGFEDGILTVDSNPCDKPEAPYELVKTMRASFDVLGPLMSRFQYAKVSLPGGCAWGPRPVDLHLKAMEALGAEVNLESGDIICKGKLKGNTINFEISSVGATKNALMAAVRAEGTTIINNAACEPEVTALADFLIKMGAKISGRNTTSIKVEGVEKLNGNIEFTVIPDRIEAGTFLIASHLCGGDITLENVNPDHLSIVLAKLSESGCRLDIGKESIRSTSEGIIDPVNVTTAPYPGFPTDLQAQWMALMTCADGDSVIVDEIYRDRFTHIAELNRLGGHIKLEQNVAVVKGCEGLIGAPVMSTDIRASASLIIAGLAAKGRTDISRVYHIDRGYEKIEKKFHNLGGDIWREKE